MTEVILWYSKKGEVIQMIELVQRLESKLEKLSEKIEEGNQSKERVKVLEKAINEFLDANGHDLCKTNRAILAAVVGREVLPLSIPDKCEWIQECEKYYDYLTTLKDIE